MSLDNFTKHQIVLLILLFVIVTAIATSVATVSLLDGGTSPVTQTIYRVVEKTIEKVIEPSSPVGTIITPKPSTVLSPANIAEKGSSSIIRVYRHFGEEKKFIALGVIPAGKDIIVTTDFAVSSSGSAEYYILDGAGKEVKVMLNKLDALNNVYYFVIKYEEGAKKIAGADLKGIGTLQIGANVVALGGKDENNVVSTGIVSEIRASISNPTKKDIIATDMILSSPFVGFLLFDSNANLVGIWNGTNAEDKTSYYLDAKVVKDAISQIK